MAASALGDLGSMQGHTILRADFTAIERFIADNRESVAKVERGMDLLVRTFAMLILGYAQQKSGGPVAPRRRSVPALAHRIPVQRITGDYFAGWQVRRAGSMSWLVFNDVKEAYLIETGMYQRVRRPILKLSIIAALKFLENSRTEQRFAASLINPRRNALGQYANVSFAERLSGTETIARGSHYTDEIKGTSRRDAYGNPRRAPVARIARRRF